MSYTTNRQPQGTITDKVSFLREGMIAEIVAINDYSTFLTLTTNSEVRDILYHIMEEEKEHYGLFLDALRHYDKEQNKLKKEVKKQINIPNKDFGKYKDLNSSKGKDQNLLLHLRDAIKGELEAIILYETFIANISDTELTTLITKIISDEKEHVEELTLTLTLLDKDVYGPIGIKK